MRLDDDHGPKIIRPLVRYHGGKFRLADWIISFFPQHRIYIEPFGGGGSVLLKKNRAYGEIYNDLDSEIVNLFTVARDSGEQLKQLLKLTPFSRDEFNLSYEKSDDCMEQARRTVVRSFMGFGSASVSMQKSGFRANSNRSGTTPAHDWANYPEALDAVIDRLQGVVIENRSAIDCINHHDCDDGLIYVDPPYLPETRRMNGKTHCYKHEMTLDDHIALAGCLHQVRGAVVLSGYASYLYDVELYDDWHRFEKDTYADGAQPRKEVIWLNDKCMDSLEADCSRPKQGVMF